MLVGLLVVAAPVLVTGADAAPAVQQISRDRFTNASAQHETEVEPDSFSFGDTVVAAFQAGRFPDGGSSGIGYAVSRDAGATWTSGFLPAVTSFSSPPGPWERATDPVVAYDRAHAVWLIAALGVRSTSEGAVGEAITVSRSTDDGASWGDPVTAVADSGRPDKEWIACDNTPSSPSYGSCYLAWDDEAQGGRLLSSRSTDGGLTWSPPAPTADAGRGLGTQPVVRPDGTVVVAYWDVEAARIAAYRSTDGGASWTASATIAPLRWHRPAGGIRADPLPSAEIDGAGRVYVAWPDCRFRSGCSANDIVISTSDDGLSWSSPTRVPADSASTSVDRFIPGLGVDRATSGDGAHLGLTYYRYDNASCTASTCRLGVEHVSSADGGRSWSSPVRLDATPMSLSWLPTTSRGVMVGDYISTSFAADGHPVAVFSLAGPKDTVFHQAIFAARLDVPGQTARTATALVAGPALAEVGPSPGLTFPNLSAVLETVPGGAPVAGRRVTFSVGGRPMCSAVTDLAGRASCGGAAEGLQAVLALGYEASFAGDETFLPSAAGGALLRVTGTALP